jgi:hypothetical protein
LRDFTRKLRQCLSQERTEARRKNRSCVVSIFNMLAKPAVVALTLVSIGSLGATAHAQPTKKIVVAMAPADGSVESDAKPARRAHAMTAPRAKRVSVASAAKIEKPDCFWCNRTVIISGVTY